MDLILEVPLALVAFAGVLFFAGVHRVFIAGHFLAALALGALYFGRGVLRGRLRLAFSPLLLPILAVLGWGYVQAHEAISCAPAETREALLRYGVAAIVFFLTGCAAASDDTVRRLGLATAVLVGFESLYGIAEHFGGHEYILAWPKRFPGSVSGTYENRDHFAGVLAIATPFLVGLAQSGEALWRRELPLRQRLVVVMEHPRFWPRTTIFTGAVLGALGVCLSFSRGGVVALVLGLLLYGGLSARGGQTSSALLSVASLVFLAGLAFLAYGADPLIERFGHVSENMGELSRLGWVKASLRLIQERPLTGSGLGTFDRAFPHVEHAYMGNRWLEHVHCDVLELPCDVGLPLGLAVLVAGLIVILRASRGRPSIHRGLVAGLMAAFAHAFVDFNLQREGSLVFVAFLAGLLLGPIAPTVELAGSRARLVGASALVLLALAPVSRYAVQVLEAERFASPTLFPEDDTRTAAERVRSLERAIDLRPDKAPYRLEIIEARFAAFGESIDAAAQQAAANLQEKPSPGVVGALRASIAASRADESRALVDRSVADLRTALSNEPLSAAAHARLALVTLDVHEARASSACALNLAPYGASIMIEGALGCLKLARDDEGGLALLRRGLELDPGLIGWAESEAFPLGLERELGRALTDAGARRHLAGQLLARSELDLAVEQLDALAVQAEGVACATTRVPSSEVLTQVTPDAWRSRPDGHFLEPLGAVVLRVGAQSAFAGVPRGGTLVIEAATIPGHAPACLCVLANGHHLGHAAVRDPWTETAFTLSDGGWIELCVAQKRHDLEGATGIEVLVRDTTLRRRGEAR